MSRLLQSSKFWLLVLDIVVTLVLYFATKYLAPSAVADIKIVIATLQPLFIMIIGAIAYEDGQLKRAGILPKGK